ncbi:hypothetical protein [Flavobacterium sp. CAU 1735]|uniref:hypothetical protein n=1 Tax=Flavobacterium sp. CAU 1735 TaxID=3140361 RepID=UPI0032606201
MMKKMITSLIAILLISCSTSNKYIAEASLCNSDIDNYFSVKLVKIEGDLQKLVVNAKNNFTNKIKKKPEFIIIKLSKSSSNPMINIDVQDYLYNNKFDKEIFNNNFVFGCVLNNTLVLFEGEENYEYFKDYLAITNEQLCVKIIYSKYTNAYYHVYELKGKNFILKESKSTSDIYTE